MNIKIPDINVKKNENFANQQSIESKVTTPESVATQIEKNGQNNNKSTKTTQSHHSF